MNDRSHDPSQGGFTLGEMLVATAVMTVVIGAAFRVVVPAQATFQSQLEVSDLQQRLRIAADLIESALRGAGSATYAGVSGGPTGLSFAAVLPYRVGDTRSDPAAGVFYRDNVITLVTVPITAAQLTLGEPAAKTTTELRMLSRPSCPAGSATAFCGFKADMRAILVDGRGAWDAVTITGVAGDWLTIARGSGDLSVNYPAGSILTEAILRTYFVRSDAATGIPQLAQYDGYRTELPVMDHVVSVAFEYFGDARPPQLIPGKALDDTVGPWTTYGPKPPPIGMDNPDDSWTAGENCTFAVVDGAHHPRLAMLYAEESLVRLDASLFADGPWCPDDSSPRRYDADLLRIRRVRVLLRLEVASDSLRGPAGVLFLRGGTSTSGERFVPDQQVSIDVVPRNVRFGR